MIVCLFIKKKTLLKPVFLLFVVPLQPRDNKGFAENTMKKYFTLFLLACLLCISSSWAARISEQQALQHAADDSDRPKVEVQDILRSPATLSREDVNKDFPSAEIGFSVVSNLPGEATIQFGIGLYDANGLRQELFTTSHTFTDNQPFYIGTSVILKADIPQGDYTIKAIYRMQDTDSWCDDASVDSYIALTIEEIGAYLKVCPLLEDSMGTELGTHTIDGITYRLICNNDNNYDNYMAYVAPYKGNERYAGDIYVPDHVFYEDKLFTVFGEDNDLEPFVNCPKLTSLSIGIPVSVVNCPQLKTLDIREGVTKFRDIRMCNALESITFPKTMRSLSPLPYACKNLKSVTFSTSQQFRVHGAMWNGEWKADLVPALTDVYIYSDLPLLWRWGNELPPVAANPNVTIHIPQGTLPVYQQSQWKDWNLMDDLPPMPTCVKWDYCGNHAPGDRYTGGDEFIGVGRADNDVEFAMGVPAQLIAPYKGCKVTKIEFYSYPTSRSDNHYNDIEYVFITKPGTDYLVKEPITTIRGTWNTVELPEPYVITGDSLFVGLGRNKAQEVFWVSKDVVDDGFYLRVMGDDPSYEMADKVGIWQKHAGNSTWNRAMPLRFHIEGENLPADVLISKTLLMGQQDSDGQLQLKADVRSRNVEPIHSLSFNWTIDNQIRGSQSFVTYLLPNHEGTFLIDLPTGLVGRNHQVVLEVAKINETPDAINANSSDTLSFSLPANTHYARRVVMEEGTGTWCGWCPRAIEGIKQDAARYPDNFIAIGIHDSDEMALIDNSYDPILNQFSFVPLSLINRTMFFEPDWSLEDIMEEMKDQADASIEASAYFVAQDSSRVAVTTQTTFGFSENGSADYRIAYVVLEDQVGPYLQVNNFSDPETEDDPDDYLNIWRHSDYIVEMLFDDVARAILPDWQGASGCVPAVINEGETYISIYELTLPDNIQQKKNLRIVTLLIDGTTGEIMNAAQTPVIYDAELNIDERCVRSQPFDVYNLAGTVVRRQAASLQGLHKGIYIINGKRIIVR